MGLASTASTDVEISMKLETRAQSEHRQTGGKPAKTARSRESLVVVGNGPAGFKFCEALAAREARLRFEVTVFGEEKRPAYNRVALTQLFSKRSADELQLAPAGWYGENEITLHTGDPVIAIDRERRVVHSRNGVERHYDKLVLATGSRPFVPPVAGADLPGVFVYRTTEDLIRIQQHAPFCRRAAILGGGVLGLEAAHAVKQLGPNVWIIERGSSLLARQLDPAGSALLTEHVASLGLNVCTNHDLERIEAIGPDRLLYFKTGEFLRVQMVVMAVGIRPRTELAADAGLAIHGKGGVVVDDFLQSSDPRIFAIGECASHNGICYGLAAPGYQMASVLAANLTGGRRKKFKAGDPSTWLKLAGISVATLGDYQGGTAHLVARSDRSYRRIALDRNRLVGATAVGAWPEQLRIQELIERRGRVWRWQRARFAKKGRLWSAAEPLPVAQWPAEAVICNCMGIRRGALSAVCARGCATADQLARATGASTVCGSCRPLLEELTGAPARPAKVPGTRTLLFAAVVTLLIAVTIALFPSIASVNSVQDDWLLAKALETSLFRQVTGFTLVGLGLIGMLLSLRKRVVRFQWGSVGAWKAVHAMVGVTALIALVTHTGMRLGQNLNLILMTNFLALAVLGGLAGAVTALEARLSGPAARRLRNVWTGAHIALVWPLPVLIVFHVLTSYRF